MKGIKNFLILLLAVMYLLLTSFQEDIRFSKIDMNTGLSNNSGLCLIQDNNGFIWIGTRDGLNRFDGIDYKIFKHEFDDSLSISNNQINCIYETSGDELWIGTANGVNKFDPVTESFTKFISSTDSADISDNYIWTICEDSEKNIWIGTSSGMNIYSDKTGILSKIYFNKELSDNSNTIIVVFKDTKNRMWVGTRNGLYLKKDDGFVRHYLDKAVEARTDRFEIRDVCESVNGSLWVGTEGFGLYKVNLFNEAGNTNLTTSNSKLNSDIIRKITSIGESEIWLGTLDGLNILDINTSEIKKVTYSDDNPEGLSNNSVRDILEDNQGGIWVATYAGGVNYFHPKLTSFSTVSDFISQQSANKIKIVSAFLEESDGDLWIGTNGGGLHFYNLKEDTYQHYFYSEGNSIAGNNIKSLAEDNLGNLWIGTFSGLSCFNKKTQKFSNYYNVSGKTKVLGNNQVHAIYVENDRKIWIGTNGGGLQILDQMTDTFFNIPGLEREKINTIFADKENWLWIGTQDGIRCIDKTTFKEQDITSTLSKYRNSLIYVNFITDDPSGNIWIGTQGYGLFLYQGHKFYWFNTKSGLNDNNVNALLGDENGQIWVTTNKGLFKAVLMEDESGRKYLKSKVYEAGDGLNVSQFYPRSGLRSKNGSMLFGGVNGYCQFFPREIADTIFFPEVILSDLSIKFKIFKAGDPGSPIEKPLDQIELLELNYSQRDFTLLFISINYISPRNTSYRYMVSGLDKDWIDIGDQRFINFTYFPSGTYELRIKATSNTEKWGDDFKSLRITVLPPWWKTGWALTIYLLLLIFLLFVFFHYSQKWAKLKHDLAMEHFQRAKEQELSQEKLRFFTDVSHELRTPLTLILTPLEKIVMQPGFSSTTKNQLLNIQRNGFRMMQLVNQILDLRKLEAGHASIRAAEGNIARFLRETSLGFKDLAASNKIEFEFVSESENMKLWYERDKMEIVIFNLLSNAFKNTPSGGNIKLSLSVAEVNELKEISKNDKISGGYAKIEVEDNGKGIPQENLDLIFDRFFTVDKDAGKNSISSGVGLELTKRLVEQHHGLIFVESRLATEASQGETKFSVWLPFGRNHFSDSEIVEDFRNSEDPSLYTWELQDRELVYSEFEEEIPGEIATDSVEKPQILIVEDNNEVREFITGLFAKAYVVEEARDGQEGLKKAFKTIPDLIISDVMMPVMDGIEFCRNIKTDIRTSHIPVILLTARTAVTFKYEGLETGADEYITKPFSARYLLLRVKNIVKQRNLLKSHFQMETLFYSGNVQLESFDEKLLKKAVEYISENISDSKVNVNKLSKHLGLSRVHFYRKIKALTNMTAVEFIRSVKLTRAAYLIKQNKLTIKEVRNMTGFEDPDYFREAFKRQFGVAPTDYIQK